MILLEYILIGFQILLCILALGPIYEAICFLFDLFDRGTK